MTAIDAADSLKEALARYSWFHAVGVGSHGGKRVLYAYVSTKSRGCVVPKDWHGYPVIRRLTGRVTPAS